MANHDKRRAREAQTATPAAPASGATDDALLPGMPPPPALALAEPAAPYVGRGASANADGDYDPDESDDDVATGNVTVAAPAATPADVAKINGKPLQVTMEEMAYAPVSREAYWAGVTDDCPLSQIAAGGITFCKRTEMPRESTADEIESYPIPGSKVFLSEEGVNRVLRAIKTLGVVATRDTEDGDRVERANIEKLTPGMAPAAGYVWLAPIARDAQIGLGLPTPAPLLKIDRKRLATMLDGPRAM